MAEISSQQNRRPTRFFCIGEAILLRKILSVVLILTALCMSAGASYSSAQGAVETMRFDAGCPDEPHADGDFVLETETEPMSVQPGPQMLDPSRVFPLPAGSGYAYEDGFGDGRDFGGARRHEGVDVIVDEGTPVLSVCSGTVTKKGWLTLGGWRIGVEDAFGVYHYYAHLSAYAEGLEIGDAVQAGDVLGYVGSTGYGPVGTSDQMIPHLHFGVYVNDIAVDPYPYLRAWDTEQG